MTGDQSLNAVLRGKGKEVDLFFGLFLSKQPQAYYKKVCLGMCV